MSAGPVVGSRRTVAMEGYRSPFGAALVLSAGLFATGCAPAKPAAAPRGALKLVPTGAFRADVRQDGSKLSDSGLAEEVAPSELVEARVPGGGAAAPAPARITVHWPDGVVDVGSTDEHGRLDVDLANKTQVRPRDGSIGLYADDTWIGKLQPW